MILLMVAPAAVVTATVAVLRVLRAPLWALLLEACALEHRARFWMRVAVADLIAGTALSTTTSLALAGFGSPWVAAVSTLRGGAAGLLLSVAAIATGALVVGRGPVGPVRPDGR